MSPESLPAGRPLLRDAVAGFSVALVLIPQALAYADLAGMPPVHGLYAAATAPVLAAPFVSSRFLQTGPVALTGLLTLGALSTLAVPASAQYVGLAALLAVLVGVVRLLIGFFSLGGVAWLMSQPVLRGFTMAAALLICGSQLPSALGVVPTAGPVLMRAWTALADPLAWQPYAIGLTALTVLLLREGKRIHRLFPGVLVAALLGLGASALGLEVGPVLGSIEGHFPRFSLNLPWRSLPLLLAPGLVIAVIGFAEAAAIARTFAAADREPWDPNREFISQGVANLAAGVFSGFPVGGSFSRSSLSRSAGAASWRAGAISGLLVLASVPLARYLGPLPRAVLGATVLGAVVPLLDPRPLLGVGSLSRLQATVGWATFAATLFFAPHVEYGVITGIVLAISVHLWREMRMAVPEHSHDGTLTLRPAGVLWFGTAAHLEQEWLDALARHPDTKRLVLDLSGLGRVDYSGAELFATLIAEAHSAGLEVEVIGIPPQSERLLSRVHGIEIEPEPPGGDMNEFWNQRYGEAELAYGDRPNDWLREVGPRLPEGPALDLAAGQGRNAIWLAAQGREVTAVDASVVGMERADRLAAERGVALRTEVADLADWDLGTERWAVISSVFAHMPPSLRADLHRRVVRGLRPGGMFVLEGYTADQVGRGTGGPPVAELMFSLASLRAELEGLELLEAEEVGRPVLEGRYHTGEASVVRILARKPGG